MPSRVSVNSTNVIWAHAVGFLAEQLRGTCPFSYGSTIDFGERIVPESDSDWEPTDVLRRPTV